MIVLGLTGSIGMGKSTTAQLFAEAGVPVYDADAAVHRLYEGEAAPAIEAAFPGTTVDGKVDRTRLSACVVHDPAALRHPPGRRLGGNERGPHIDRPQPVHLLHRHLVQCPGPEAP